MKAVLETSSAPSAMQRSTYPQRPYGPQPVARTLHEPACRPPDQAGARSTDRRACRHVGRVVQAGGDATDREKGRERERNGTPPAVVEHERGSDGKARGGVIAGEARIGGMARQQRQGAVVRDERTGPVDQSGNDLGDGERG